MLAHTHDTMDTSLSPKELDVQRMLACEVHIGTCNVDFQMERYVWRRRQDGTPPKPSAPYPPRRYTLRSVIHFRSRYPSLHPHPHAQASTSSTWARPWTSSSWLPG